jgi:PAS domain S-box-containing protein
VPNLETIAKFFTVVPDPMVLVNSLGMIVLANEHTYTLFGYKQGGLAGKPVACLLPERYRASHGKHLEGYFKAPTVRAMGTGMELSASRADGSEFPVEICLSPYRDTDAVFAMAAIRDISERKHLEEDRRESQRQKQIAEERASTAQALATRNEALRAIFETSPLGMITATQDGTIDRWNRAAEKIYGYSSSEVIGTSIWDITKAMETEEDSLAPTIDKNTMQVQEVKDVPARRRRKDGKIIDVSLSTAQFHDASGGNSGFFFLVDDISERKAIEQQLRQSQKMEAVGQLTGGIAHDFNNLLGIVIGKLDLLENLVAGNEAALKRVRTAQKGAMRGADLTRRLLAFSSSEELRPSTVKLQSSIRNMIELAGRALGPEINITTHFDASVPDVFVDAAGLENALLNLVVNARDAMPRGGSVNITTQLHILEESYPPVQAGELKAGQYACVSISDTGSGMSRETLDRAFEPFFTTKARGKGTGLGLAMVYGFVKQSGGTVRIYSEPGYGTTVSFYLPLAEGMEIPGIIPSVDMPAKFGGTVLVVDDEIDLLDIAVVYLADMGYTALHAVDGANALRMIERHPEIDLVMTDIIMPGGMNGVELAQKIRQLRPEIKVIYCSGFPADALAERTMPLVDGPLLHKPYQRAEFRAMIHGTMDGTSTAVPKE